MSIEEKMEWPQSLKTTGVGLNLAIITSMLFDGKQISFFEAAFPIIECQSYKMAVGLNEII